MKRSTVTQKGAYTTVTHSDESLTQHKPHSCHAVQNGRMQVIFDLVGLVFRGATKIALLLVATIIILGAFCVGLLTALFMIFNFLLTGRKPTFVTTFNSFRQTTQQYQKGHWPINSAKASPFKSDVVDVESREVRSVLTAPPPTRNTD